MPGGGTAADPEEEKDDKASRGRCASCGCGNMAAIMSCVPPATSTLPAPSAATAAATAAASNCQCGSPQVAPMMPDAPADTPALPALVRLLNPIAATGCGGLCLPATTGLLASVGSFLGLGAGEHSSLPPFLPSSLPHFLPSFIFLLILLLCLRLRLRRRCHRRRRRLLHHLLLLLPLRRRHVISYPPSSLFLLPLSSAARHDRLDPATNPLTRRLCTYMQVGQT